ncbi:MAG: DegV family protein [Actinomycetota bacterium]
MNKIAIVTDSTADIPDKLIKKHDISIAPLYIHFKGKEYKDKTNITNAEIYELLEKNVDVKTSAPSPKDFLKLYSSLIEDKKADTIFSIHISSKLSNTIDSAKLARNRFPDTEIEIFDSKSVSMSLGLVVLEAAKMVNQNKDKEFIKKSIDNLISKSLFLATVDNFEYLLRGGRVSGLKRLLNMALKVRPIFIMDQGKVKVLKVARTRKSSINQVANEFKKRIQNHENVNVSIFYGEDMDAASRLSQKIKQDFELKDIIFTEITPVIGTHSGPSIIGVSSIPALSHR